MPTIRPIVAVCAAPVNRVRAAEVVVGVIIAAATPCSARPASSTGRSAALATTTMAARYRPMPHSSTARTPMASLSRPPGSMHAE